MGGVQVAQPALQELGNGVAAATKVPHLSVARFVFAVTFGSPGSPEGICEPPYSSASSKAE